MTKAIKWELKKAYHTQKYVLWGYIALLVVMAIVPANKNLMKYLGIQLCYATVTFVLVGGCIYYLLFPCYNMIQDFKWKGYNMESLKSITYVEQLVGKLSVNLVSTIFLLLVGLGGSSIMRRFPVEGTSGFQGHFHFTSSLPIPLFLLDIAIVYPMLFLLIYSIIAKKYNTSHGISSFIIATIISSFEMEILHVSVWLYALIDVASLFLLFYLLIKWVPKIPRGPLV